MSRLKFIKLNKFMDLEGCSETGVIFMPFQLFLLARKFMDGSMKCLLPSFFRDLFLPPGEEYCRTGASVDSGF